MTEWEGWGQQKPAQDYLDRQKRVVPPTAPAITPETHPERYFYNPSTGQMQLKMAYAEKPPEDYVYVPTVPNSPVNPLLQAQIDAQREAGDKLAAERAASGYQKSGFLRKGFAGLVTGVAGAVPSEAVNAMKSIAQVGGGLVGAQALLTAFPGILGGGVTGGVPNIGQFASATGLPAGAGVGAGTAAGAAGAALAAGGAPTLAYGSLAGATQPPVGTASSIGTPPGPVLPPAATALAGGGSFIDKLFPGLNNEQKSALMNALGAGLSATGAFGAFEQKLPPGLTQALGQGMSPQQQAAIAKLQDLSGQAGAIGLPTVPSGDVAVPELAGRTGEEQAQIQNIKGLYSALDQRRELLKMLGSPPKTGVQTEFETAQQEAARNYLKGNLPPELQQQANLLRGQTLENIAQGQTGQQTALQQMLSARGVDVAGGAAIRGLQDISQAGLNQRAQTERNITSQLLGETFAGRRRGEDLASQIAQQEQERQRYEGALARQDIGQHAGLAGQQIGVAEQLRGIESGERGEAFEAGMASLGAKQGFTQQAFQNAMQQAALKQSQLGQAGGFQQAILGAEGASQANQTQLQGLAFQYQQAINSGNAQQAGAIMQVIKQLMGVKEPVSPETANQQLMNQFLQAQIAGMGG